MQTHERTHQTMLWALILTVILALCWAMFGCASPTAPDAPPTPAEQHVLKLVNAWAEKLSVSAPPVGWFQKARTTPCDAPEWDNRCPVAGAAPNLSSVEFWRPYVNGQNPLNLPNWPDFDFRQTTAHEVCHVAKKTYNEDVARVCAIDLQLRFPEIQ